MKKFVSIALALVLALSLTVVAFAAVDVDGETTDTVKINYSALTSTDGYFATIVWDNLNDVAYTAGTREWDTENMWWETKDAAEWTDSDAGTIVVNNNSSKAINVSVTDNSDYLTVTGGTTVAAATPGNMGTAATGTAGTASWTVTATGAPDAESTATITVSITAISET